MALSSSEPSPALFKDLPALGYKPIIDDGFILLFKGESSAPVFISDSLSAISEFIADEEGAIFH